MKKILLFLCFAALTELSGQLTVRVTDLPANTPAGIDLYIAGSFNDWNPGLIQYKLSKDSTGIFSITFSPATGTLKFKFTRGSWETVEGSAQGTYIPDRAFYYNGQPQTIELSIAGWEGIGNTNSTASPQVSILSDTFDMPQLGRKRKIWLYLPKDYYTSTKSYPVLYMHDGQNLFDKRTSFSGEWRVDESLDSLFRGGDYGCIVVGVDNGGTERLNEYSPWVNSQYGGGLGDEYIEFMAKTLKPYIDLNYRTLSGKDHTGMMGSSMGGLISMYAGIQYPEIFGRIGAFSSSYWFSPESFKQVEDTGVKSSSYFYLIAGAKEGGNQVSDTENMYATLLQSGAQADQISKAIHDDGKHSEWYWARSFSEAYLWLFEKKISGVNELNIDTDVITYHDNAIYIKSSDQWLDELMYWYDLSGKQVATMRVNPNTCMEISNVGLQQGMYIVMLRKKAYKIFIY